MEVAHTWAGKRTLEETKCIEERISVPSDQFEDYVGQKQGQNCQFCLEFVK